MLSSSSTGGGNTTSSSDQYPDSAYPPFSPNPRTKTMEEVWKDINLSSLHDHCPTPGGGDHHHHHNHNRHRRNHPHNQNQNFIFQDFFSRPFDQDPLPSRFPPSSPALAAPASRASPLPTHATVLSLHSGSTGLNNGFMQRGVDSGPHHRLISSEYPIPHLDDALDCAASLPLPFQRKRVQDSDDSNPAGGGDRRHKRMIKNRESAARSRARKQAYTNELELEVQHLLAENGKLKKQQEELRAAAASSQVAKRSTLFRTSTAPF